MSAEGGTIGTGRTLEEVADEEDADRGRVRGVHDIEHIEGDDADKHLGPL